MDDRYNLEEVRNLLLWFRS